MSNILKAHLALLGVNLIYGANYIIAKGVMPDYVKPFGFIFLRVIGALILFVIMYSFNKEKIEKKDYLKMALCAVFGVALNQSIFFKGLSLTSPINSSVIMTFTPAIVLVLGAVFLKEKLTSSKIIGIIIGGIGAVSLILLSANKTSGSGNLLGDVLILANATSYAIYLILVKPLMLKYKPITVITHVFFFGFLMVIPISFNEVKIIDFSMMPSSILMSIAFVVIGTTFLAYLLNIYALNIVSPTISSVYIYLQPLFASIFLWITTLYNDKYSLANEFSFSKIICALLIFLGVFLVSYQKGMLVKKQG